MISLSNLDISIIILFFSAVLFIGFLPRLLNKNSVEDYVLSGRKVGMLLFILTNVSTWYGGILGVGEFTYSYGIVSWVTQGLPYYIFAIVFAFFLAPKIRATSLLTIPDKIESVYGKKTAAISSIFIFILVTPAPYLLMMGNIFSLLFDVELWVALFISILLSILYLFKGGYKSDLFTDAFQFVIMFAGFIVLFAIAYINFGGFEFLEQNLPEDHLSPSGGFSRLYLLVWFFIALWTFTDPGFHQRCYAAKNVKVAKWGIIISIFFWALFDFLTTTGGLYAKAILPNLENPVQAYPILADKILGNGLKGLFFAALFATVLSTLNSFMFLSGITFGQDIFPKISTSKKISTNNLIKIGMLFASIISFVLSLYFQSVIQLWYLIGSLLIPGLIFNILGSYFLKLRVSNITASLELIMGFITSLIWYLLREMNLLNSTFTIIEPMLIGLGVVTFIHLFDLLFISKNNKPNRE